MTAWDGPVAFLDVDSTDGRRLDRAGYREPRQMPMPLMMRTDDDGLPDVGLVVVGLVESVEIRDDGAFDTTGLYLHAAGRVEPDARYLPYAAEILARRLDAGDRFPCGITIGDVVWDEPPGEVMVCREWRPMSVAVYADPALAVWPGVHIRKADA